MYKLRSSLKYFSQHVNQEIQELYLQTGIANLALSLVFIFQPIYLYTLGYSLISILWFFAMIYGWYLVFITFGAKFASRFGYKHAIFLSNIFYVIFWSTLYLIDQNSTMFFVAPIFFALQKAFFWPAFHADMALMADKKQEGREVGVLYTLAEVSFIIGPFFGGLISEDLGFLWLFVIASGLMLISAVPLFYTPDIHARHKFRFKQIVAIFKQYPMNFLGYLGFADELMVQSLWPVFIFIIVGGFIDAGIVSTVAALIAAMVMLYVGRASDQTNKQTMVQHFTPIYALSWIFRFLVNSLGLVVFFDAITKIGYDAVQVAVEAESLESGGRNPDHAIAYMVFYEGSMAFTKVLTSLLGILILSLTGNIFLIFILTGFMTMLYGFVRSR
jgi:MFS family permease